MTTPPKKPSSKLTAALRNQRAEYMRGFDEGQASVRSDLEPQLRRAQIENIRLRVDLKTERELAYLEFSIAILAAAARHLLPPERQGEPSEATSGIKKGDGS